MKMRTWLGLLLAGAALGWVGTARAAVGEKAPAFKGKEFINTPKTSLADLKGQVILYEIFRTW